MIFTYKILNFVVACILFLLFRIKINQQLSFFLFKRRRYAPVWQLYPLQADGFTAFNWDWLTDDNPNSFVETITKKTCYTW